MIVTSRTTPSWRTALVVASVVVLASCASFQETLALPNSRVMTLRTLNEQVSPGMSPNDVVARIGRPASTFPVGWQKSTVWNYRFAPPEGDCVVFQVSFSTVSGVVTETGQGYDSACDGPSRY